MADAPVVDYVPVWGVEPWSDVAKVGASDFGGGAINTKQNLLVTLWTCEGDEEITPLQLIRPTVETPYGQEIKAVFAEEIGALLTSKTLFNSRISTRFSLAINGNGESDPKYPLLGILNPPQDLKNQLLNRIVKTKTGYRWQGSFGDLAAWSMRMASLVSLGGISTQTESGAYLPFVSLFGFPLFKTDGSDGNPPVQFPIPFDAAGLQKAWEFIVNEEWYIGWLFGADSNDPRIIDFSWSNSPGRQS